MRYAWWNTTYENKRDVLITLVLIKRITNGLSANLNIKSIPNITYVGTLSNNPYKMIL